MAFSDQQSRALKAKLDAQHVKTRKADGSTLHYIEGWHAIAEANRIFGYDAWDRRTLATRCVWTGTSEQHYLAAYTAKVRIRVRAGEVNVVREGSGSGEGKAPTPGQAHDIALKSAETDATKRALATFGNPFGLALYDREQAGVRQRSPAKTITEQIAKGPWMLRAAAGDPCGTFNHPDAFATALRRAMTEAQTIELLFAVWEQNLATVRAVNYTLKRNGNKEADFAKSLVAHLKSCAVGLVNANHETDQEATQVAPKPNARVRGKIDKSVLALAEPKRLRSKEHLRHVARQACLICGRTPSQAHHIRYAQARGLGLKVSDEFTVPLCAIHHTENHAIGDERLWWQQHKVDPLPIAEKLWKGSQQPS
jgi:Rad52/22 family double-strand break repair protein